MMGWAEQQADDDGCLQRRYGNTHHTRIPDPGGGGVLCVVFNVQLQSIKLEIVDKRLQPPPSPAHPMVNVNIMLDQRKGLCRVSPVKGVSHNWGAYLGHGPYPHTPFSARCPAIRMLFELKLSG